MPARLERNPTASRAAGRCIGAMFFSIFGAVWLLFSCAFFKRFTPLHILPVLCLALILFSTAMRLKRTISLSKSEQEDPQKKRDDRTFGIINAVTYIAVFLLFLLLPRFGLENYIFPAFVGLVGIHFFPMPPSYQHRSNLVTGAVLIAWAILCAIVFRPNGDRMAAFACLGAGITLWASAGWALKAASQAQRSGYML